MAKKKGTKGGRFVTLKSGQVIFIPHGKKSKWADVREKVLAGRREEAMAGVREELAAEPKPGVREVKREPDIPGATPRAMGKMGSDEALTHLKEMGWSGASFPQKTDWFESKRIDLGGGQGATFVGQRGGAMYGQYGTGEKGKAKTVPFKSVPTPEEFTAAVRGTQAKDGGWKLGAAGKKGRQTTPVDLGGGSTGYLQVSPEGGVTAYTKFKGGYDRPSDRPIEGLPSVEEFKSMFSTE